MKLTGKLTGQQLVLPWSTVEDSRGLCFCLLRDIKATRDNRVVVVYGGCHGIANHHDELQDLDTPNVSQKGDMNSYGDSRNDAGRDKLRIAFRCMVNGKQIDKRINQHNCHQPTYISIPRSHSSSQSHSSRFPHAHPHLRGLTLLSRTFLSTSTVRLFPPCATLTTTPSIPSSLPFPSPSAIKSTVPPLESHDSHHTFHFAFLPALLYTEHGLHGHQQDETRNTKKTLNLASPTSIWPA